MGNSKPPDKPGTGFFNQGLAAYQRTIKKEADPEEPAPADLPEIERDGLLKTNDPETPEIPESPRPSPNPSPPAFLPPALLKQAPEEKDSKYRRVAKFLVLIGGEEAAKILANLDQEQIEAISLEIARISFISNEEAEVEIRRLAHLAIILVIFLWQKEAIAE